MAESFNAIIKLFRANLRGVADKKFLVFRIATYMLIPTEFLLSPESFLYKDMQELFKRQ